MIVNNSRFLILPWVNVKNLASKVLLLAIKQIQEDWLRDYCYAPVLLETLSTPLTLREPVIKPQTGSIWAKLKVPGKKPVE